MALNFQKLQIDPHVLKNCQLTSKFCNSPLHDTCSTLLPSLFLLHFSSFLVLLSSKLQVKIMVQNRVSTLFT